MSEQKAVPQLIGHADAGTPTGWPRGHGHRPLPDDLLLEASRRLGIMACLGGVLWVTGVALKHVAFRAMFHKGWLGLGGSDLIGAAGALASFGLYFYTRRSTKSPAFILELGHGFLIFTSVALGMIWHWETVPGGWPVFPQITWIGAVVLMYAAIVPSAPAKTLVTGIIAVSMNPISMVIAKARGAWNYGPESNVLLMHYPDYLLVGVGAVISAVVTRLGHQVSKARELGSYQIGELLGEGGMGQVYRATHRMLARPAAIKLIRPEALGGHDPAARDLAVKRFHREAEVAANLRSPHTVALYDFGATEDETLYFVMELLEGMNLETLVQKHGPVPANRVIYIVRQVCDSLEEAHALGLVHRDIKPANIHIGQLGLCQDFVKVLDFGLVKSVKSPSGSTSGGTAAGMTPGTPDYMAPEMTMGEQVDARADLYALGCVAYFLLTAKPIFDAANVFHMIARHLNDIPLPPSQRAGIPVPAELERVVLACVEKQPDRRPQSAALLRQALREIDVEPWGQAQAAAWWNALPR
jgi:eukaryotic-like serine/threonine-protein kinase